MQNDGTGTYFDNARYCSSSLDRFASQDWLGFASGSTNFYGYASDASTDFTDPLGLCLCNLDDSLTPEGIGIGVLGAITTVAFIAGSGFVLLAGLAGYIALYGLFQFALLSCV
ncbi:MAG TPA: hypothetical protein VG815_01575 [Chloroflexota bacterium]|jgi:RHS repeat-associated protein|nr:hypothetical protein [Chloroflexota bacterium]